MTTRILESFGRVHRGPFAVSEQVPASGPALPFGNGKSYGDSCLPALGGMAIIGAAPAAIRFDPSTGLLEADCGVSLADIILHCGPLGWFLPVTPGTKHVSLGGAIANDVHGKNHHLRGSFGCHVVWLDLARSDGITLRCSGIENAELFSATIGGMGLTGHISRAAIRMMDVPGVDVAEKVTPFGSLDAYFDLAEAADNGNEYAVAWIDQLANGRKAGRGLLFTGNHVKGDFVPHRNAKLGVPFTPPVSALNGLSVRAFNTLYRLGKSRNTEVKTTHYDPFFYPLDGVSNWNRLYGPRGLHQHQSIIPFDAAKRIIPQLLQVSRDAGQASFLTVIKRFGDVRSPGILSFARPGYTLTLDFPHQGAKTLQLLDLLDAMTIGSGGAVNPYKDSRMAPATFAASFPRWRELEAMRDPVFVSGFWARTAMRL
ncbi:MAG: FAD-binding oxidoreductase [Rhizobiaceae bacterium]